MGLTHYVQTLIRRFIPRTIEMPSRILPGDAPRINDGLTYELPVLLPQRQRDHLVQRGKLREFLAESVRDSYRFQFDTPGRSGNDDLILPVTEDPLREWHWQTRVQVLTNTHAAYSRNPIAKRAVHYVSSFVVGDGFNLSCKNKEVERVLQEFINSPDNAIREYERQAVRDLMVDGELFLRYYAGAGEAAGQVVVVPLRPWEVQYISTEKGFFRRPVKYHMQPYTQYNTDAPNQDEQVSAYDIDADEVQHVAINRHSYELRGRPELYSALPWLRAHKEWLENRARQNHWRGAMLWWVKIIGAAPQVIAAKLAQYTKPPTPGSIAVTSDKEEWSALSNPIGASDAGEDGRQLKIMALNAIAGIPEYMTGDGENANLATSKSQQLPVLKTFSEFQTIMVEQVWIPMFKRVLTAAIDSGDLDAEVEIQDTDGDPIEIPDGSTQETTCDTLEAFAVQYEPIGDSEPFTLAQALDIAANNGWLSARTATTELGYDYTIEQKQIAVERQKERDAMTRGEIPPPPGMTPDGMGGLEKDAPDPAMMNGNGNGKRPPNA